MLERDDGVSMGSNLTEQMQSKNSSKKRSRMEGRIEEKSERDEHCPNLSLVTLLLGDSEFLLCT